MGKATKSERATAYHEAGHAVAGIRLHYAGVPKRVTIIPEGDAAGRVEAYAKPSFHPEWESGERLWRQVIERIVGVWAGFHAEKRYTGRGNYKGAEGDIRQIIDLSDYLVIPGEEETAFLKWLSKRTENFVSHHWEEIKVVAEALLEAKTLTGKQVRALIVKPIRTP